MHALPNRSADCEAGKAGAALERGAGEDGGAAAAAEALSGAAVRRVRHCGAAVAPRRRRARLAVAAFLGTGREGGVAVASRVALAPAAAGAAAGGLRRVPVRRLLGGAGGLAAPVRAGGAAARPPRLLQSVPGGAGRRGVPAGALRRVPGPAGASRSAGLSLFSSGVTNDVTWEDSLMVGLEGALLGWCVPHPPPPGSSGYGGESPGRGKGLLPSREPAAPLAVVPGGFSRGW